MKKYNIVLIAFFILTVGKIFSQTTESMNIYPNPFNDLATIGFEITQTETITLKVFDIMGLNVRTFFESIEFPSGLYKVNVLGDNLSSGLYIVRLSIGSKKNIIKKVLKYGTERSVVASSSSNNKIVVTNNSSNEKITVYPNPTADILNVPIDGIKTFIFTDMNGKTVKTVTIEQNFVSLKDLPNGLYFMSVLNGDKVVILTDKIIKT